MPAPLDHTGQVFNQGIEALSLNKEKCTPGIRYWRCRCLHCGNKSDVRQGDLGKTKSCGCLKKQKGRLRRSRLTESEILAWADQFIEIHARWPRVGDGEIKQLPSETWRRIDNALRLGLRGLPSGSSLHKLLAKNREQPSQSEP